MRLHIAARKVVKLDIEEGTVWYGFCLLNKDDMEITEHLKMNGYTFYTSGDDIIFVYSEEVAYVETIFKDNGVEYEIL